MGLTLDKKVTKEAAPEAAVEATPVAEDGVVYGSARKNLAFVCALGDPSQNDTTTIDKEAGTKKVTSKIVGYKFKALADMKVPDCGTNEGLKKDAMNYVDAEKWIDVKAGTEVRLTPFETALLLSQPEFNAGCDGGEKPVVCVYTMKEPKNAKGEVATASAAAQTPRVSLRAVTGSIKDFDIEDVLTFTEEIVNGKKVKHRTIKDETVYAKWIPLTVKNVRKASGKVKAAADPNRVNESAKAFLSYVNNRKAK